MGYGLQTDRQFYHRVLKKGYDSVFIQHGFHQMSESVRCSIWRQDMFSPVIGSISWTSSKVKHRVTFDIKDGGFGWHEAVDHTELCRVWTPGYIVDRTVLRCFNTDRKNLSNKRVLVSLWVSVWAPFHS